jgi:hypothetical protein
MEAEDVESEEVEDQDDASGGGIESYPWKRAVRAAPADSEDPCPACDHPLRHHKFSICTSTNAFARNHGRDWRYSCDSWVLVGEGDGASGTGKGLCPCAAHGIEDGREWPAEYRQLYRLMWVDEADLNTCEDPVVMDLAEWEPYEPPQTTLDAWA